MDSLNSPFIISSSGQSQTMDNLRLPVILSSVIPSTSGQEVSPFNYLSKPIAIVHHHLPQ